MRYGCTDILKQTLLFTNEQITPDVITTDYYRTVLSSVSISSRTPPPKKKSQQRNFRVKLFNRSYGLNKYLQNIPRNCFKM